MKFLLDTNTFLWWTTNDNQLSRKASKLIKNSDNDIYLSSASCWEIAIKHNLGKITLPENLESFIAEQLFINHFEPLQIEIQHALNVANLPYHHKDPFDRILVSQSQISELTLITNDRLIKQYDVNVVW